MRELAQSQSETTAVWLPTFISLMIVLLSLLVFLITFSESDNEKIKIFKKYLRENLMILDKKSDGISTEGNSQNPLQILINRMKSDGVNKKLMDNYLTVAQIKKIPILDGEDGVCLVLPDEVFFDTGSIQIVPEAYRMLNEILPLVTDLLYIVEIKGYSSAVEGENFIDTLELTSKRAYSIYSYFVENGVSGEKLTVTGYGNNFSKPGKMNDKVEIVFKEQDY